MLRAQHTVGALGVLARKGAVCPTRCYEWACEYLGGRLSDRRDVQEVKGVWVKMWGPGGSRDCPLLSLLQPSDRNQPV